MRREHERGWLTRRLLSATMLGAWSYGAFFTFPSFITALDRADLKK